MLMTKLKEQYINDFTAADKERVDIEEKIAKKRMTIANAESALEKLYAQQQQVRHPGWIESLIHPLAKELSDVFDKQYELYGPFGLRNQISIYWRDDMDKPITEQPVLSLSLVPGNLAKGELQYETGRENGKVYPKDSIAYENGFHRETLVLPDSLEEIIKLVRKSEDEE